MITYLLVYDDVIGYIKNLNMTKKQKFAIVYHTSFYGKTKEEVGDIVPDLEINIEKQYAYWIIDKTWYGRLSILLLIFKEERVEQEYVKIVNLWSKINFQIIQKYIETL